MLVGRSGELARLDALVAAAHAGSGGFLAVVGYPGMGKSTMLDALGKRARRRDLRVLHVRATEWDPLPGSSLWDLLMTASTDAADPGRPPRAAGRDARAPSGTLDHHPTLLLLDDAHLANARTLELLRTAHEQPGHPPLAAVVTCAPGPVLQEHLGHWPRLWLTPLDGEAARTLLRAGLGPSFLDDVPDQVLDALHGNPTALVAAPDLLSVDQLAGRAPLPTPMPVPAAVMRSWAPTLDQLGRPAQGALRDVAISGGRLDLLTAMAGSTQALAEGLDEGVQAGVIVLGAHGQPAFQPADLGDVVIARTPAAERRRAHRRAAEAAMRLNLPPGTIVDHLGHSIITADATTAAEIATYAERAEREEHYVVAARAWETAAHMTTVPSDRVAFALSAIRVSFDYGLPASEDLLQIVTGDALDPRAEAHIAGIRAEQRSDLDPDAALTALIRQVDLAEETSSELMPTLLLDAIGIALQLGDTGAALRHAQRYADLDLKGREYPQRPDPPWTASAVLAAAHFQAGQVAQAMPLRQEAIAAAAGCDPRAMDLPMLMATIGLDDILLDISPEASDRLLVALERASGDSGLVPCLFGIQAWRAKARGDWRTARTLLGEGRPMAETAGLVQPWLGMTALSVELAAQCGDDEVLRIDARRLREVGSRCHNRRRLATLDRALGLRALAEGRLGDAVTCLSAAADAGFLGRGLRDAILPAGVDLIEALVRSGDYAQAAARHGELHHLLAAMGDPLATALDERAAALVTGGDESEEHYHASLTAHARASEPFEQARTHLLLGEYLRRSRRRVKARTHLHSALHTFDELGASPWSARAGQELRAAGGQPSGHTHEVPGDVSALTPQERAVALAVSTGMSNREVAEALSLSIRTVEYHLAHVYRKLEVHGRGALARALGTPAEHPQERVTASRTPPSQSSRALP